MKNSLFPLIVLVLSTVTVSCIKKVRYSKEELYYKAVAADPSVSFLLPSSISAGSGCAEYTEGCVAAHHVMVKNLEMIAVEFKEEANAIYAARKYRGYYSKNWFFDDVTGEPSLEKFVSEKLEAKKP